MTVQLQDVKVLDNPATFTSNFKFQITFDCVAPGVKEELEWKLVYVGSADNEANDQELDQILVGPVRVGKNRFTFEAPAPDPSKIPTEDLLDVTVILLTCSYKEQEFIRIGYYVHNEYETEFDENDENCTIVPQKIRRNILSDKPRVTRFNINWDNQNQNVIEKIDKCDEETKDDCQGNDNDNEESEENEDEEEDLADTEEIDNKNMEQKDTNNSNHNTNKKAEAHVSDDEDIDMTE